ncbi:hypothetical protein ACFQAT_21070 [Undibacterium arcticum]
MIYGSDEWKSGPREAILALIDSFTSVVIEMAKCSTHRRRYRNLSF